MRIITKAGGHGLFWGQFSWLPNTLNDLSKPGGTSVLMKEGSYQSERIVLLRGCVSSFVSVSSVGGVPVLEIWRQFHQPPTTNRIKYAVANIRPKTPLIGT